MPIPVGHVIPGSIVFYHKTPCIVLGATGRSKNVMLMLAQAILCVFGMTNNFTGSSLRSYLNGAFLETLTEGNPKEIIPRTIDLTAHTGSVEYDRAGATRIAPLTFDEFRVKYFSVVPRLTQPEWSATPWGTGLTNEDSARVLCASGKDDFAPHACTDQLLCRPAFLRDGLFFTSEQVTANNPANLPAGKSTTTDAGSRRS